jgi:hypothetical protein
VPIPTDLLYRALPQEAEWCKVNFQYDNIFSNQAAAADLRYEYTISWQEGVRRAVAWLDKRGRISAADEPPFYERLLRSWERLGQDLAAQLA